MKESEIEKRLVRKVRDNGGLCLKFVSPGFSGVPDRIVIAPLGRIYFIELKRPKGKPRKLQRYVINLLIKLGCDCRIIDSIEAVNNFVSEVFENAVHTT